MLIYLFKVYLFHLTLFIYTSNANRFISKRSTFITSQSGYLKDSRKIIEENVNKSKIIKEHIVELNKEGDTPDENDGMSMEFIKKLSKLSQLVYDNSSVDSPLFKPPGDLNALKSFSISDNNDSTHFLFKVPNLVEYLLITECMSLLYLSVFVDDSGIIYLDGISDSSIIRGILAILLSFLNNKPIEYVKSFNFNDYEIFNKILSLNLIKKTTLESIIQHISNYKPRTNEYTSVKEQRKRSVAVLVSGGVDSSISLWMLKERGYHVEAFYLKIDNIVSEFEPCDNSGDIEYVSDLCTKLGIKLNIIPFSDIYRKSIVEDLVHGYSIGETPNPDVECNSKIKFGQFLKYALDWGFDYVASGHYARLYSDSINKDDVENNEILHEANYDARGFYKFKRLYVSKDLNKDQTYFLCRLTQPQLDKLIFPIGHFNKSQVRDFARILGLRSYNRKDSMGLCFLGKIDLSAYLTSRLGVRKGPIVDYQSGNIIGEHNGIYNYTIGQKTRINKYVYKHHNPDLKRYVLAKDYENNKIYVTDQYNNNEFLSNNVIRYAFNSVDTKWIVPDYRKILVKRTNCDGLCPLDIKIRHSPNFRGSLIKFDEDYKFASIALNEADPGISTGQYVVFYHEKQCIGSSKIVALQM